MSLLCSITSGLKFWLVNQTSIYENSELKVFKNVKFFGEISSNWPNDLLGIMNTRLLNLPDNGCSQHYNGLILHQ